MSQEHPTVWTDPNKKFKGVNMQAVKVLFKSHPIHHPPEVIPEPIFAKDIALRTEKENAERLRAAKAILEEGKQKQKEVKAFEKQLRDRQNILREIRTSVAEAKKKNVPEPPSVAVLRKKLADFPKRMPKKK